MKCPICSSEYSQGQDINCPTCQFPLRFSEEEYRDLIAWIKPIWMENRQNDRLFADQNSPSLSNNDFKQLQERFDQLEQFVQNNEQFKFLKKDFTQLLEKVEELSHKTDNNDQKSSTIQSDLSEVKHKLATLEEERSQTHAKLGTLEEERSQTQEQLKTLQDLSGRLERLERYLKAKQDTSSGSTSSKPSSIYQEENTATAAHSGTFSDRELSLEEYELVEQYNQKRETLSNAEEVSETKESITNRRLGSNYSIIFAQQRRGNYWIVEKEGRNYLVPSDNLRLNEYNVKTVESVFECRGFQPHSVNNFQLLQPAIVKETNEGKNWQLDQPGILQF